MTVPVLGTYHHSSAMLLVMDILFGEDQHLIAVIQEMKYFYYIATMYLALLEHVTMDRSLEEACKSQIIGMLHSWMSILLLKWMVRLWNVVTKVAVLQKLLAHYCYPQQQVYRLQLNIHVATYIYSKYFLLSVYDSSF